MPTPHVVAGAGARSTHKRSRTAPLPHPGGISWASLPQGLLEQLMALLPLRSVATAARVCQAWAPAARVVRLRAQLQEALLGPEELIWRRYSGGAEHMGREGFARWTVEVVGWAKGYLSDHLWGHNAGLCGGSTVEGIDRAGFVQGMYIGLGRDPVADADKLADQTALQALVAEVAACGAPLRGLREALEARLAEAALMRPLWTASAPQLVDILVGQHGDVDTVKRCCRQLQQRLVGQPANQDAAEKAGCSKALVAALQAHSTDAAVQQWGCRALKELVHTGWLHGKELVASHPANQTAAAAAGGIEAVVAALRAHPINARVQGSGLLALYHLAHNHPTNTAAISVAGGAELARAAQQAHPDEQRVQTWAKNVLQQLA
eukprot:COSAG01_NODE_10_length_42970_cov_93.010007_19_plen_378_part_00